jgi:hypothetical protein
MAFDITELTRNLSKQTSISPQIVLQIDGIDYKFSTDDVLRMPRLDEGYLLDDGLFLDTPIKDPDSRDYISAKGSSRSVSQQLIPEKGGSGSVTSFKVALLNYNGELTSLFQSNNIITDILGRDARVWLSFKGAQFPTDYIKIFDGFIDNFEVEHNVFTVSVAISSQRVRQSLFNIISTTLDGAIDNSQTTLDVDFTTGFIIPTAAQEEWIESYIKIDDELMKLSSTITPTQFQNVTRGQLSTSANSHDNNAEITSFIRLKGNPIDLTLRLLMSNPKDEYFIDGEAVDKFVKETDTTTIENAIFFKFDIKREFNILTGDIINVSGASEAANNFTGRIVREIISTPQGSFITVDGDALVLETGTSAVIQVKSQYNVLPEKAGLGMKPKYVDLEGILAIDTLLGASLPDIDIYVKDEIKTKEWLEKEIFKPVGLFGLTRKGRYSIYAALPPLNSNETIILNETNIMNLPKVKIKRSTTKNHYNSIVYKFQQDSLEDEFKAGVIIVSQDSINRIPVGNKQLSIEAAGLRDNVATRTAINRQAQRLIDKYRYSPQHIKGLQIDFRVGYTLEVGDSVIFGGSNVTIPNTELGLNYFPETLMQIENKSIDISKSTVTIDLINSAFGLEARFGVISPSSFIESSGPDYLILKRSFATTNLQLETLKWEEFVGRKVRIRDEVYTKEQILTIKEIGEDVENKVVFEETISIVVNPDDILDLPSYDESEDYHKTSYVYANPQVEITAVTDAQNVDADVTNLFIGAITLVHSDDYTNISQEVTIDNIVGNTVTFSEALNYTPSIGDKIELIGFSSDEGLPYRYI